jgi:hypothetical protein
MTIQQLSVHIENQPGRLYRVTEALGSAGINIRGLTLQEAEVNGTLRLITSDIAAARNVLMDLDIPGTVEEVLAIRIPDTPGSLSRVLKPLFEAHVNLRYAYSFLLEGGAVIILRCADNREAEAILLKSSVEVLSSEQIFGGGREE